MQGSKVIYGQYVVQKNCGESDDRWKVNYSPVRCKSCRSVFFIQGKIEIHRFPLTNTSINTLYYLWLCQTNPILWCIHCPLCYRAKCKAKNWNTKFNCYVSYNRNFICIYSKFSCTNLIMHEPKKLIMTYKLKAKPKFQSLLKISAF